MLLLKTFGIVKCFLRSLRDFATISDQHALSAKYFQLLSNKVRYNYLTFRPGKLVKHCGIKSRVALRPLVGSKCTI